MRTFSYCTLSTRASTVEKCNFDISLLTPWSTDVLEKLTVIKLVKKYPISHGTQRFIVIFKNPVSGHTVNQTEQPKTVELFN